MNLDTLIEILNDYREEFGGDAEVRLMTQQNWPFENRICGVTSGRDMNDAADDEDEDDFAGLDTEIYLPPTKKQPQNKVVDLKQYRHDYEITNFEAEERELIYSNGTHYLV